MAEALEEGERGGREGGGGRGRGEGEDGVGGVGCMQGAVDSLVEEAMKRWEEEDYESRDDISVTVVWFEQECLKMIRNTE